jgi:hypothetical protein
MDANMIDGGSFLAGVAFTLVILGIGAFAQFIISGAGK